MSNAMTFLVYETMDWEYDHVIAVASTYEKAIELLVEHLNSQVYRPDRVDLMQDRSVSRYHNTGVDNYHIVQTVIDGLHGNNIALYLDNHAVILHSRNTEFQQNGGYFAMDVVKSMLETSKQWKHGVSAA